MRGYALAAFAAAAIIALLSLWRISERSGNDLVDPTALAGGWVRTTSEACNPPLPEQVSIADNGSYAYEKGEGALRRDADGRFNLHPENGEYPNRIFRANSERLELLNQFGCKATYARAE